jgi:hypothetical protein
MNDINMTLPIDVCLTAEETQLLDLWHACGLGAVLKNAHQIDPILLYLQYGKATEHGFVYDLSYPYFNVMARSFWHAARLNLARGDTYSFMWMYHHLPYEITLKLLRAKLSGGHREVEYLPSGYNADHLSFTANEARWAKYCTVLAIEGFPIELGYRLNRAIDWFSSYENLQGRFKDYPVLPKMRQSLLRLGNRGHHDFCSIFGRKTLQLRPHTAGVRKYMNVKGLDRLEMMRHYSYFSSGPQ